jgi:cyclic pyranopterin phosphate synthase
MGRQEVRIGWITPQSESFCEGCNRLRLDSRGKLYRCLIDPLRLDILDLLTRQGEEAAVSALSAYLLGKRAPGSMISGTLMTAVGG